MENIESINSKGLDNRRRSRWIGGQSTLKETKFIDAYTPVSSIAKVEKAVFLFTEESLLQARQNYPNYAVYEVDYRKLEPFYLVAFNHIISTFINGLIQTGKTTDKEDAIEWVALYWETCVRYDSYIPQMNKIKEHNLQVLGIEYLPEVLYFGDHIPPEFLTLITE